MQNTFSETGFAKLYLWITKAKFTMGVFFLAFILAYLLFGLIAQGPEASLGFFTAVQMMFACFFIGLTQQILLPTDHLTKLRCVLWMIIGTSITITFSLIFGWFSHLPLWCSIAFFIVLAFGMAAMIIGYYLELHRETKLLNKQLAQFQNSMQNTA